MSEIETLMEVSPPPPPPPPPPFQTHLLPISLRKTRRRAPEGRTPYYDRQTTSILTNTLTANNTVMKPAITPQQSGDRAKHKTYLHSILIRKKDLCVSIARNGGRVQSTPRGKSSIASR